MPLSRYLRPRRPASGLALQPRDRAALEAIRLHRFLTSDQVHALLFEGVILKRVQRRLRRLWEHRLLDRHFLPVRVGGPSRPVTAGRPYYTLTRRALALLSEDRTSAPERPPGLNLVTLQHDALAVEFLVALEVACRGRSDVELVRVEPEWLLWQQLKRFRDQGGQPRGYLVPDAAVTLRFLTTGRTLTFYLELVRADVKGGNRTLQEKLRRYVRLKHDDFFKEVFGHESLRAVIIATTSARRAEHFRRLAESLVHGRRLFWFGAYEERTAAGERISAFSPDTIFVSRWTGTDGQLWSILPAPVTVAAPPAHF